MEQSQPAGDDASAWVDFSNLVNENYAYSAPPDGSSLAPYDASHYPVAAQANDQAAPFAYPLAGSLQQWDGSQSTLPAHNYTQDTSGEFTYGQTASYLSQFSAIDAQHAGWQPTSQSLSTSTSLGSMVASSTGSSIAVPVDGYYPSMSVDPSTMQHCVDPSTMRHVVDPSTVQHGVGAFPLQSPMQYGAQQDANSPYYQSYSDGYMNYQYPTGYPQLPLLQQSPSIAGGPTFQAPGSVALSRCSSKSSRSSLERQKKTLTEREKQEICLMAATQPNLTQAQIAKIFIVDRSTISKVIKNNKEKLERQANNIPEDAPVKAPRGGVPRYQTVEDALGDYLDQMVALNSPVTDHVLQERAIAIGMEQNISAFKASPKWISMFKQRRTQAGKINKPDIPEGHIMDAHTATPQAMAYPAYPSSSQSNTPAHFYSEGSARKNVHRSFQMTPYPGRTLVDAHPAPYEAGIRSANASPGPSGSSAGRGDGLVRSRSYTLDAPLGGRALASSGRPRLQRHQTSASLDQRKRNSLAASAFGFTPAFGLIQDFAVASYTQGAPTASNSRLTRTKTSMHVRARSDVTGWHLGTTPDLSEGDARSINTPLFTPGVGGNGLVMNSLPVPDSRPPTADPPAKRSRHSYLPAATATIVGPVTGSSEPQHYNPHVSHHHNHVASPKVWATGSQ